MNPDRLSKGVRIGALALLVSALAACGTATVVRPGGGNAGGVTTPKTSVPKPGQTVVVRRATPSMRWPASMTSPRPT